MKYLFTLFLFPFFVIGNAQSIQTIELLAPESNEHYDLHFLKEELQGKDVVMLGEYTHMFGNIFEMKARIIEYLHRELGFTTIAIEAPMYDIWKMNQTGFDPDQFNNAIWGVWGNNEEFQRLVTYIKENDLKVIGFDSQIMDTSAFIEDFFDFCEENKIAFKLDEDDLGIIIEGVLEAYTYDASDIKFEKFEKELQSVIKQIGNLKTNERNDHWIHFSRNLLAAAREAHRNNEIHVSSDFISGDLNSRDKEMANNLLYHINQNKGEKMVVWADNIHVMNDNSSITKPSKTFISTGNYIKKEMGERVYSLATIHANDSIYDNGKWQPIPILKGSFEDQLRQKNKPYIFVSSNQEAMRTPFQTRLLSFDNFYEIRLDEVHDGYVFLASATLPGQLTPRLKKEEPVTLKDEKEILKSSSK
jgi:erythromycin esterase-like protein